MDVPNSLFNFCQRWCYNEAVASVYVLVLALTGLETASHLTRTQKSQPLLHAVHYSTLKTMLLVLFVLVYQLEYW